MSARSTIGPALVIAIAGAALVVPTTSAQGTLAGEVLGTIPLGSFDEGATEIVAYHPGTQTVFSINGETGSVDLISLADPASPVVTGSVSLAGDPTSVAVNGDLVAVAVLGPETGDAGSVVLLDPSGTELVSVPVGMHPDMVTFTPDGAKILSADEGEPNDDYSVDPEGSVTIIDLAAGPEAATAAVVGFGDFEPEGLRAAELSEDVRIYGPNATVAQDIEPEYIAISPDGSTAYVSLQENDAIGIVDIPSATITDIVPLGAKDFGVAGAGIDPTDEDGAIAIAPWPAYGLYMPDGLATYAVGDTTYLVSANEGDTREYEGYEEQAEVGGVTLDPTVFPDAVALQAEAALGKLEITGTLGDPDGDGDFDALYAPGARSFSIWDASDLSQVFDSGDQFEQHIAETNPENFNATNDEQPSLEDRSDNAGPEPEGVVLGTIGDRTYAFIGVERQSGVFVYDITEPTAPTFVTYLENRDWSGDPAAGTAGDLGPEGLVFIPAVDSPTNSDLLLVSNEVSGTLTVWSLTAS